MFFVAWESRSAEHVMSVLERHMKDTLAESERYSVIEK